MPFTELIPYLENTHFASTITSAYIQQQLGAQIVTNLQNANFAKSDAVMSRCISTAISLIWTEAQVHEKGAKFLEVLQAALS